MKLTTVKKIAAQLRLLQEKKRSSILFLGAGASQSAGIPLAGELGDLLLNKPHYKELVADCVNTEYATLMNELPHGIRKDFLNEFITNSKLNQTHLYAASLMKAGYIDIVVTVNFDPLMLRALSVLNIFPSVYDMAISREFIVGGIEPPAVVYLHGQNFGFWQLNTQDEMPMALDNIRNLFNEITSTRAMIVVGYSGSDPVFSELAKIQKFEHGIFWVGYKDSEPRKNVKDELLDKHNKGAWFLPGLNSDEFFRELKNALNVEEPDIIKKPFSHLKETVQIISEFEIGAQRVAWTINTLKWIEASIEGFELGKGFQNIEAANEENIFETKLIEKIKEILDKGLFEELPLIENDILALKNPEASKYLSYALNDWGNTLKNLAIAKNHDEVLFAQAFDKYKRASEIVPDMHHVLYNWGIALADLAEAKNRNKALFIQSSDKYKRATEIKPDMHEAFLNWGNVLSELAIINNDEALFDQAFDKYKSAININPDKHEAFYNWGNGLVNLAASKNDDEALILEACDKYNRTVTIKPDMHEGYFNWGIALKILAIAKNHDETLMNQAFEKFSRATNILPEKHAAFFQWGITLEALAIAKNNDEMLLKEAFDKLQIACRLFPQTHSINALANTASLLSQTNATKTSHVQMALRLLLDFNKNHPGLQLYNIACMYSILKEDDKSIEWLEKAIINKDVSKDKIESDHDLNNIRQIPQFQELMDKYFKE
jgi:tetratricopeptide (TPR) repeat protein